MITLFLLFLGVLLVAAVVSLMVYAWAIISLCAVVYVFANEAVKSHKRKKLAREQPQASISNRR